MKTTELLNKLKPITEKEYGEALNCCYFSNCYGHYAGWDYCNLQKCPYFLVIKKYSEESGLINT